VTPSFIRKLNIIYITLSVNTFPSISLCASHSLCTVALEHTSNTRYVQSNQTRLLKLWEYQLLQIDTTKKMEGCEVLVWLLFDLFYYESQLCVCLCTCACMRMCICVCVCQSFNASSLSSLHVHVGYKTILQMANSRLNISILGRL
jgi:hypothetical protein